MAGPVPSIREILTAEIASEESGTHRVPREYRKVRFDEDGTGAALFTPHSPYLVLCSAPYGPLWPINLGKFLIAKHIDEVAILYAENDLTRAKPYRCAPSWPGPVSTPSFTPASPRAPRVTPR